MFGSAAAPACRPRRPDRISTAGHPSATKTPVAKRAPPVGVSPAGIPEAPPPTFANDDDPDSATTYGLTPAERDVLWLLADGSSNREIAQRRGCAVGTVKVHLVRIYAKLGVGNRTAAARIGQRLRALETWRREADPNPLRRWMAIATSETRCAGETLFQAGDAADALYFIQDGIVEFPELRATLEKGAVFGEIGVFSPHGRRTASARCSTRSLLFRLDASQARRLYLTDPMFARSVMELVSERITEERLSKAA
ncbi:MAG: LuxR C-terminal-related transcriptional regulator [Burkholderiales bacterium]